MNAIEIKNLSFSYDDTRVFGGVDLTVPMGRFAALIGDNGAGKSTLIKMLLGELPIAEDHGTIKLMGNDLRRFCSWQEIAYVPQNGMAAYCDFPASVEEIVQASLYTRIGKFRFAGKKEKELVGKALAQVGMESFRKRLIGKLSGGQQQRVLLARALVNEPKLLILDEPTSGVDEKNTEEFYRLLKTFHREDGLTIFMVTHDRKRLPDLADEIWQLAEGTMRQVRNQKEADPNGNI